MQLTNPDNIHTCIFYKDIASCDKVVPLTCRPPCSACTVFTISLGFKCDITIDPVYSLPAGQTATSCHSQWNIRECCCTKMNVTTK